MKIGEYEQMMSWLTRPEAPAPIEPRQMYNQGSSLDHAVRTIDPVQDSGNKIEEVLKAYGKYQGDRKGGRMSFSKFFELYSAENFAVGGRVGFEDGSRGKNRKKGTTLKNLFKNNPKLENSIAEEYKKGSGADRIIRDLKLKNKISARSLQDYINEQLNIGTFKSRKGNRVPDVVKQPGEESRKFMDYIENIIDQNPGKKNMFQNLEASEVIKNSGADINTSNASRILSKIYNLGTKGSKLENFYPNIEKRAIELLNTGMGTPDVTNTLIDEKLIDRQLDPNNKTSFRATKSFFQRLIDSGKTEVKKLTTQPGYNVDVTTRNIRDEAIKNLLDQQSSSITTNRISTTVSEQLGEKISPEYVKNFFKRNNINIDKYIKTTAQRIFPEVQTLDKIVKKNIKYLTDPNITFVDKGQFLSNEYTKIIGKNKAQTVTANEAGQRLKKLLSIYAGTDQKYGTDLYNKIKPLSNYTDPNIQKNLISLTTNLSRFSNIDVAKMLGLPEKDIQLLQDLQKATSELGDFKIAGDHTDIKAIMSDFPNYKKNFLKIQYISNDLNTLKSNYDRKIISLYNAAKAGASPETIIPKLEKIQQDFKSKTGYDIGGFSFNKNNKISIDPKTVSINEYRYPINDNVIKTMGNIESYENKKYTNPLDKEVLSAQGSPNKLESIYQKYKGNVKVINDSKYVKGLDNIPKLKGFKNALLYGGAGAATIFATTANADINNLQPEQTEAEGVPAEAIAAGTVGAIKYGPQILKALKSVGKAGLKTVGSLPAAGTFAGMEIKKGMGEGQSFVDAASDPLVGLELLLPETVKKLGPLMARAARISTPIGATITTGGTLKNRAKEMMRQAEGITALPEGEKQRRLLEEYAAKDYKGYNQGGRVNFADGPENPKKRKFMKIMGGLATLPIVGRLFDVAQVAEKTAPVVKETLEGAPDHFFKIYNAIKRLGKDVTLKGFNKSSKPDREIITELDDYILSEDLITGEKTIQRMKIDNDLKYDVSDYYGKPIGEEVYMSYRPGKGQIDETMKGKTPPNEYTEDTALIRSDRPAEGEIMDTFDGVPDDIFEDIKKFTNDK